MFFLNPERGFIDKIYGYLLKDGFKELEPNKVANVWNYKKGDSTILVYVGENAGMYQPIQSLNKRGFIL